MRDVEVRSGVTMYMHLFNFIQLLRLEFEDVPINILARESRLVLQLFGKTLTTADSDESKNSNEPVYKEDEIGWTAIQFFNYEG